MADQVLIVYVTSAGEEHEERWDSIARFRAWAMHQGALSYTAYVEDEDGEWVVTETGKAGGGR